MNSSGIKLVHDSLVVSGGAERVAAALCQIYPQAPMFTSAWLPEKTFLYFKDNPPHTMTLSKLARSEHSFKALYPLWWLGFRNMDFKGANLILSSSSYLAKFIRPPKEAVHICYLHNPFRYLWERETYGKDSLPYSGPLLRITDSFRTSLQRIDRRLTRKITHIITNSQYTAKRIRSIYDREAEVVYPPINFSEFPFSDKREDFYLYAGRLLSYKRADLAIKACRSLGCKLLVAGSGPQESVLRRLADENIIFTGNVSDDELKRLYARARALIFPGLEDFGIIPVEAQATGCPVIAFGQGGILESVIPEQTGIFFDRQSPEVLMDAILRFEQMHFNHRQIRQNSKQFDVSHFKKNIQSIVERFLPQA